MPLDGSAEIPLADLCRHYDAPPSWDGVDPSRRWRAYRRELLLWQADTEVQPARQAVKTFHTAEKEGRQLWQQEDNSEPWEPVGEPIEEVWEGAVLAEVCI
eukprot:4658650-Amphidinium_carterae.5